ncbi:hydroxymethylglutaryl-CoA reductase, degradative [Lachnospiraceae bacterium ZAX-1]
MLIDNTQFEALLPAERLDIINKRCELTQEDKKIVTEYGALTLEKANSMVENCIGTFQLPYSVITNVVVDGKEYLVPVVGEEPYVFHSSCSGAELAATNGGFISSDTGSIMIGQVQILDVTNPETARLRILEKKADVIKIANDRDPMLVSVGGGCIDVEVRVLSDGISDMVVVHLLVDARDAMGAQAVNAMTEAVSPLLTKITGGRTTIKVLSNLANKRLVRIRTRIKKEDLGGSQGVDKIVSAYHFAKTDQYRATTNNKGVMNGIIPAVIATGNDTRAVESGAHSYAARSGKYSPLTIWEKNENGDLEGMLEMPMAVGIVGGTTKIHPLAQLSLKIMKVDSAIELAKVLATVGMCANLGVLKSLTTVGLFSDFNDQHKRSK